jgi:hypothetical protein
MLYCCGTKSQVLRLFLFVFLFLLHNLVQCLLKCKVHGFMLYIQSTMWGIGFRPISKWNGIHLIPPALPEDQSLKEGFCIWACRSCLIAVLMVDFQYKIIIEVLLGENLCFSI